MKKQGFTLAEVLVTLGIIGVVAALTTPALIQNVGNAKVGPKLQKAVATFETASEMMLTDQNANSLLGVATTSANLGKELGGYMKIVNNNSQTIANKKYDGTGSVVDQNHWQATRFDSDDGLVYYIHLSTKVSPHSDYADIPNNQLIGDIWVDINGPDGPNRFGKDLFKFALYNDGTLRPWGGKGYLRHIPSSGVTTWSSSGSDACNKTHVGNGGACAGSIFDNGMKIIYQ